MTGCCQWHLPGGCWYDACCKDCPDYLCRARLYGRGATRRMLAACTLRPNHDGDHDWAPVAVPL